MLMLVKFAITVAVVLALGGTPGIAVLLGVGIALQGMGGTGSANTNTKLPPGAKVAAAAAGGYVGYKAGYKLGKSLV